MAVSSAPLHAQTALAGPWYTGSAELPPGTPSFSPDNTSDSFTWGSPPDNSALRGLLWTYFDDVALANDGDYIRVSFTAQWPTAASLGAHAFRIGLFDNGGSILTENSPSNTNDAFNQSLGYFGTINLGGTGNALPYVRHTGNPSVLSNQGDTQTAIPDAVVTNPNALPANTPYQFSFEITRNSATEYGLELIAAEGGITATTTTIVAETFNTFYLLNAAGTTLGTIQFSDFLLESNLLAPSEPFQLIISASEGNPGNYDFTWNSQPGKVYDLFSGTNLADPIDEWPVYYDGETLHEAIPATGTITTLTAIPSPDPRRFFALREYDAPVIFEADFEDGDEEIISAAFPLTVIDDDFDNADWERSGPHALPVGAPIRIVWSLTGTGGFANDYLGWYVDDVVVRQP